MGHVVITRDVGDSRLSRICSSSQALANKGQGLPGDNASIVAFICAMHGQEVSVSVMHILNVRYSAVVWQP